MGLSTTAKIISYDGRHLLLEPVESLLGDLTRQQIKNCEIRLDDGRRISADQRKKIFAIIREISQWSGNDPEYIRSILTWDFCCFYGCDGFSLSNVDMTTAKDFISFLIEFCFMWDIPTKDTMLNRTEDIGKYLYACLMHKKCAICNQKAELHHVNRIGMGFNREQVGHIGLEAQALCREHHTEVHTIGQHEFNEKYHIYGIKLDENLCGVYTLRKENKK